MAVEPIEARDSVAGYPYFPQLSRLASFASFAFRSRAAEKRNNYSVLRTESSWEKSLEKLDDRKFESLGSLTGLRVLASGPSMLDTYYSLESHPLYSPYLAWDSLHHGRQHSSSVGQP